MADTDDAVKVMIEQAATLGLKIDKRWSPETLAQKIVEAQDALISDEQRAFDAAPKTPVRLKKDAFLITDVRSRAGAVVGVPVEMARYMIDNGVAERADPLPGEQ